MLFLSYGNTMKKTLFKSYFGDESDSSKLKAKFIYNRIKIFEKHVPEIGRAFYNYIDKEAKCRDCSDKIALVLQKYVKEENVTSAFKLQVSDFANILLDVGTSRDAQVKFMENKVLQKLSDYDKLCKVVQSELKLFLLACNKEKSWKRQLKNIKESHTPIQQNISLAEAEFLKAKGECTRCSKNLEEQIDIFEKKKLNMLKDTLLTWTLAELNFHSKALKLFTDAYRIAANINVNADLEEFREKLKGTDENFRDDSLQRSESILQLISQTKGFSGNGIPHPSPSSISDSLQSSPTSTWP